MQNISTPVVQLIVSHDCCHFHFAVAIVSARSSAAGSDPLQVSGVLPLPLWPQRRCPKFSYLNFKECCSSTFLGTVRRIDCLTNQNRI